MIGNLRIKILRTVAKVLRMPIRIGDEFWVGESTSYEIATQSARLDLIISYDEYALTCFRILPTRMGTVLWGEVEAAWHFLISSHCGGRSSAARQMYHLGRFLALPDPTGFCVRQRPGDSGQKSSGQRSIENRGAD
jgi:hypothetical protein